MPVRREEQKVHHEKRQASSMPVQIFSKIHCFWVTENEEPVL